MQKHPMVSSPQLTKVLDLSKAAVNAALATVVELGLAEKTTGQKRARAYSYLEYLRILREGTDPV